jgi:hypothetical protein
MKTVMIRFGYLKAPLVAKRGQTGKIKILRINRPDTIDG